MTWPWTWSWAWLSSAFNGVKPKALIGAVWHLILRVLGVRAPSIWNKTTAARERYTDAALEPLRAVNDPSADDLVSRVVDSAAAGAADQEQARIDAATQLLRTIVDPKHPVLDPAQHPPGNSELIAQWIASIGALPPDIDPVRIRRASEFFSRNSFLIALVFSTSALFEAYACPKGVRSLAATDYLINHTDRRLGETMQWILIVEDHREWLSGRVMAAILKIRLMHATIRRLIYLLTLQKGTPWKDDDVGVPICGEDLLGMLMGFAATPIRDLPKLGVAVSRQDAEDHLYLWRVVGRYLAVDESLIPRSLAEAKGLVDRVKERLQRKEEEGRRRHGKAFAEALLRFHLRISPGLDAYAMRLIQDLVGKKVFDLLEIEPAQLTNATVPVPRPVPLLRDFALGALEKLVSVLPGPIGGLIVLPSPGSGDDHVGSLEVPGTAAAKRAHATLKRRETCELWGKALLSPTMIKTETYSRPDAYEISPDMTARWDKKDKKWRQAAKRLRSRVS